MVLSLARKMHLLNMCFEPECATFKRRTTRGRFILKNTTNELLCLSTALDPG